MTIEPQEGLDRLRAALEAATVFVDALTRTYPFSAHMTIAEFISTEQTKALMRELADQAPEGVFRCDGVCYLVPDTDFCFTVRRRLELARC